MNALATLSRPLPHDICWQPEQDLTYDEYVQVGKELGALTRVCQFWIGDWVNYGETRYGAKYDDALLLTGYDYSTLRTFAWVSAQVPVSRRRDTLSFSHHREVAQLPEGRQDEWLDRAERDRLPVSRLRAEIKASNEIPARPETQFSEKPDLTADLARVRAAVRALGEAADADTIAVGWAKGADQVDVQINGMLQ